jgi:hypothetical protein
LVAELDQTEVHPSGRHGRTWQVYLNGAATIGSFRAGQGVGGQHLWFSG